MLKLSTPITQVPGTLKRYCPALKRMGVHTVGDLLLFLPFRYEEFGSGGIGLAKDGESITFTGQVLSVKNKRAFKRRMTMTEAVVSDGQDEISVMWFNQPYLVKTIAEGKTFRFAGKVKETRFGRKLMSPQFENPERVATPSVEGIMPVYPMTTGITQRAIRTFVKAWSEAIDLMEEPLPEEVLASVEMPSVRDALRATHFPTNADEANTARARLAFDELLVLQLAIGQMRSHRDTAKAEIIPFVEKTVKDFVASFPFVLTNDQRKAAWDVLRDMEKGSPMYRMLDGDVGTGKTAVAMIAARNVAEAGKQSAIMAPTEILAQQHFASFTKQFTATGLTVALWTNSYKRAAVAGKEIDHKGKKAIDELAAKIAGGEVDIIIGTHALIQTAMEFADLGFAVVDEQHRFGVRMRQALVQKSGDAATEPHLLSMTATPIPRSLALTVYGDLDLSLLKEKPADRKPIETSLVPPKGRAKMFAFLNAQLDTGRQAYIVAPLIDRSIMLEAVSVTELSEKLTKKELKGRRVGVLHGKLPSAEKEEVMRAFSAGGYDVLISTSVIEVGVDVPNATIMCIEGAERFGLAQLHQFRGRIGRGAHASHCFLLPTSDADAKKARLKALVTHDDGFSLAEQDLEMRGPGDLLGSSQTGFPELRFASVTDMELVQKAREAATKITEGGGLEQYPELAVRVRTAVGGAHLE